MSSWCRLIVLGVVLSPAPVTARAQVGAGITGVVADASNLAIPGATVSIVSVDTGQVSTAIADTRGSFRVLALPVGAYRVTASADGFREATRQMTLGLGETADVRFTLTVAAVAESVTVAAPAPIADVVRTESAQSVTPAEVRQLPLNGRNYLDLALLTPGVSRTNTGTPQRFAETSAVPGTGISISSQRNLNNTFVVDGLSANDDAAGLAGTFYSQDVVREFQVISSGAVAEFGRASSGVISVVTRSGSNEAHGDGYAFFRSDRFDARNPLTSRRDPLSQQQGGATFGGPLLRDRTFLFANVEATRNERSGLVTIDPLVAETINDRMQQLSGQRPVATGNFPTGFDTLNVFARADQAWSAASRAMWRYSSYRVTSRNARSVGGLNAISRGTSLDDLDQTGAFVLTSSIGAATLNELRAQVTRSRLEAPVNDEMGPSVTISGVASFGTSTVSPTARALDVVEVADTLSLQRRRHLLKLGMDSLLNRVDIEFPGPLQGAYTFASLAAFQQGRYVTFQQAFGKTGQFQSNPNLGGFAEDEWRISANVTLNAGLRYDLQWLPSPIRTDSNNLSPRLGVAWAPAAGRAVIRANAGVFYDRIPLRATSNALQRDGSGYQVAVMSPDQAGAPAFPATLAGFPSDLLISITTMDPRIHAASSRQAAVSVEQPIGRSSSIEAGYQHVSGNGLIMSRNVNAPTLSAADASRAGIANLGRPDPRYANVTRYESVGRSAYDALVLAARTHGARFDARTAYTWSRAMDDAGNFFFSQPQNASDVHADWGPSDNDQRHRLTLSGTMRTGSRTGWLADWQMSGIFSVASALPFNVQTGTDNNNDTNVNDRPAGVTRNSARGFDYASVDLRVSRRLAIGGAHLELLAEAFNLLNRANFAVPNNIYGNGSSPRPSFGQPTAALDPRQVQFGVRVEF